MTDVNLGLGALGAAALVAVVASSCDGGAGAVSAPLDTGAVSDPGPPPSDPGPAAPDPGVSSDPGLTCTPGQSFCNGDRLFTCKAGGGGYDEVVCPHDCQDAACLPDPCADDACAPPEPICQAGTTFCGGKDLVTCSDDGLSTTLVEACPYGCATGTCAPPACAPGETRCAPDAVDVVEVCLDDRTGWKKAAEPCAESCAGGQCVVTSCEPGEESCGPEGVMVCNAGGSKLVLLTACEHGCASSGGGPPVCAKCPAGKTQCSGSAVQECSDPVAGWTAAAPCSELETCADGQCVAELVLSGPKEGAYLLLTKALVACFVKAKDGQCRALDTTGLSAGITPEELTAWFCDNKGALEGSFASPAEASAANDIMGCGFTNVEDLTFHVGITPGLDGVECIGFSSGWFTTSPNGKEVVVDLCTKL